MKNQDKEINIFDVANYISKKIELNHLTLNKIFFYSQIKFLLVKQKSLMKRGLEI
ncbi:MAG: hypothetical protein Q8784_02320 [Vigna little leaf phytoplasma]|nr:hypothetical protein [Vigna little leaf phytoplasma]